MDTFWLAAGGWWVRAAVAGGGVLLLAWLSAAVFRRPAWRQQVGAWAVRGAVLAAALAALPNWLLLPRPAWMTPPAPADATAEATPEPPAELAEVPSPVEWVTEPQELALPTAGSSAIEPPSPSIISDSPVSQPAAVVPLLLSAYALVAGVLLLQLVWEWLALTWLLRDSAPLAGRARRVFDRLTAGERPPLALSSARVRSPLCVGYFRPRLVLPKGMADAADEPTLRWVLAHELDHLRRGDTRTACWVGVARAVFFFVPWFWVLRKDLTLCQEYLADAAAAGTGDTPADYAAFLVELSGGRSSRRPLAAARMRAGKSELFRRVHMLLTTQAAVRGATRGFTWLAGTAAVAAAVGLSGLGFADEPKKDEPKKPDATVADKLKDLQAELSKEMSAAVKEINAEKDPAKRSKLIAGYQQIRTRYAPKFLELAKADPSDPAAFGAAMMAVTGGRPADSADAAGFLIANYADDERMTAAIPALASSEGGRKALTALAEKTKNKAVAGQIKFTVVKQLIEDTDYPRTGVPVPAAEAAKKYAEAAVQLKELVAKYGDEKVPAGRNKTATIAAEAKKLDFFINNLTVGKPAPAAECATLEEGKTTKLSDYKGKVVVMDVWATWCPPCRAMIPHEREMVKKLKDKPFVLLSVSADAKKETLTEFLDKEPMPWTHWWNGATGNVLETFQVRFYPTIYVIDAKGVIRFKHLRGDKLEEAVEKLIAEIEKSETP